MSTSDVLQDDPQKAADTSRQKSIRSFYGKWRQPPFIVGPSEHGSGLQARLNPAFNQEPAQSSVHVPRAHPFPAYQKERERAISHYRGTTQPSSNQQAPMPLARAAFSQVFCDRPDRAEHESIAGASKAAMQQAWEKV